MKTKTRVVSIYVGYCWLYWMSGRRLSVALLAVVAGRWVVQRWEVWAAVTESTSVQGIGVTASRPLDFLNVLQDHVM